jgi:hypothetical protein
MRLFSEDLLRSRHFNFAFHHCQYLRHYHLHFVWSLRSPTWVLDMQFVPMYVCPWTDAMDVADYHSLTTRCYSGHSKYPT